MALSKKKIKTKGQILERVDPGTDVPIIFRCKRCGVPISKAVRLLLHAPGSSDWKYETPRVAPGFYFLDAGDFVLNLSDLQGTLQIPDMGCCGQSGLRGLNVTCANGHEVATEFSDCCTTRDVVLEKERVSPVPQYE